MVKVISLDENALSTYQKEYYAANKERIKARVKAYKKANHEKITSYQKQYRIENLERVKATQKAHYAANKEKVKEHVREYASTNSEKVQSRSKKYYKNNRDKLLAKKKEYHETHMEESKEYKREYYLKNSVSITCIQCGKQATSNINTSMRFCSHKCALEWHSGPNSPNWLGGISFEPYCPKFNEEFKKRVREFFDNRCVMCGKHVSELNRNLAVHHISYDKMVCCNDKPPRFVALCTGCHTKTSRWSRDRWEYTLYRCIDEMWGGRSYYTKEEYAEICKQHPEEDARQ
jgi:hypothetical protein